VDVGNSGLMTIPAGPHTNSGPMLSIGYVRLSLSVGVDVAEQCQALLKALMLSQRFANRRPERNAWHDNYLPFFEISRRAEVVTGQFVVAWPAFAVTRVEWNAQLLTQSLQILIRVFHQILVSLKTPIRRCPSKG
jgi:hypothetical protein